MPATPTVSLVAAASPASPDPGAIDVRGHGSGGATVVLLHGGPGAPGSVGDLADLLSDEVPVLEPLQRRSGPVALSVAQHVADLAAVAPPVATLVGWSWGAMLALSYASRHPDRVRAIALIGCGTYDEVTRAAYRRAMNERLGETGRRETARIARQIELETDPAERDALLSEMGALAARAQSRDLLHVDGAADGRELPPDARGHEETWADVLRLQVTGTEPAAFAAIRVPVAMFHGDDDPHPGPATRDLLRGCMPQLEYDSFERCGHEPWRERAARDPFLGALRAWLRAHAE
jgi:pimeloyl-ACP methyl ester carboxylesterase